MKSLISTILFVGFLSLYGQSYVEKEVSIGELKGTLSVPNKETKTAILMISGSGPTDRNGNSAMGFTNNSLKMVAQSLSEDYAVLRYDKRGIAKSQIAPEDQANLRFDDFIKDARRWLDLLTSEGYKNLIIAGHSQGSLVGMLAAQNRTDVKAFISISGLAEDAGEAIVRQISAQSPALGEETKINMDSLRNGHSVSSYSPFLISIFNPQVQPFLKSYIKYNPSDEIKKLDIPILVVNGTTDIQVGEDQAKLLNEASPDSKVLIIDGMNHVLKDAPNGDIATNMATYNNPDLPLSNGLISGIKSFIETL